MGTDDDTDRGGGGTFLRDALTFAAALTWGALLLAVLGGGVLFAVAFLHATSAVQEADAAATYGAAVVGLYAAARAADKLMAAVGRMLRK